MTGGFTANLAWREGRSSIRRLLLYTGAIVLGVGALVAIHSFRADVQRALQSESQTLLGADIRLAAGTAFSPELETMVDSLEAAGVPLARGTQLVSMVRNVRSDGVRLLQVRALEAGWPFYGEPETVPAGLWERVQTEPIAVVDPAVLVQLDAEIGDTLAVGNSRFVLAGTVTGLPNAVAMQTAVGPRVFIARSSLEATGLLTFGSLARYQTYLAMPERADRDRFYELNEALVGADEINYLTAAEYSENLTIAVEYLSRYLGLVGLAALLLGGIGVGSAIHVYIRERLVGVAVLRCIGAVQSRVFRAYLLQAAALGTFGSLLGVLLGIGVQQLLPVVLADVLPVEVETRIAAGPLLIGGVVGAWVSVVFALGPLLEIRGVPPLMALRHDVEPHTASRGLRAGVWLLLVGSVVGIAMIEAPSAMEGVAFAGALAGVGLALWGTAVLLVRGARRFLPRGASYPWRQGLSNLYRPGNQTTAVTFALGFGAFVVGTIGLLQMNLVREFEIEGGRDRANLLLFDIQSSQVADVQRLMETAGARGVVGVPLVPSRLLAINGLARDGLDALEGEDRPEGWAIRREYRHTYRSDLAETEVLTEGTWFGDEPRGPDDPWRVSIEDDLAESLRVGVGDRITWSVGGTEVETTVTSLRTVDWQQFAPNFFVVFEPGAIDGAPQTRLTFGRIDDEDARNRFQRELVRAHPNVSVLDLSRIQETVERVLARVNQAVRFLGGFCTAAGLFVLIGALATTRYQRMREGALLRTMGARRSVVIRVLLAEYAALGVLAVATGLILALVSAGLLLTFVFETAFDPHPALVLGLGALVTALTVAVGLASSRGVLNHRPLQVLRTVQG